MTLHQVVTDIDPEATAAASPAATRKIKRIKNETRIAPEDEMRSANVKNAKRKNAKSGRRRNARKREKKK